MTYIPNPPAFPRPKRIDDGDYGRKEIGGEDGMELRDWFAGQALAGLCAARGHAFGGVPPAETARVIYTIADAMLVARVAKPDPETEDDTNG